MANRLKEDERNERIIRNLLKLPDNRRCVNCNSLGPQYVCTNFWTFVCTTCGGIHREFTHRVKSVSMAKFTPQEVSALQAGGNAKAKELYLKDWDSQRHSVPDSSNVERLRDFIKHVYVDRRYTSEKSFDKPPRVKMGEAAESIENQSGSRSPPYENRYSDRHSPGGRSDDKDFRNSYDQRSPGFDRKSPARTEVVNDWRREDRFGNARTSEGSTKLEGRSPDRQQDSDISSHPVVRPVREILGDSVSPLRIIEPPKANGGRGDGTVRTQRTTSSSSLASSDGNPTEIKKDSLGSLIDFDAAPDPPTTVAVAQAQAQPTGSNQSAVTPTTSSSSDNWACFDSPIEKQATQASSNLNSLDSVLSGLSVPPLVSNATSVPSVSAPAQSTFGFGAFGNAQTNNTVFPSSSAQPPAHVTSSLPPNGMNPHLMVTGEGQRPTLSPQQFSALPATSIQSSAQPFGQAVSGPSSNQPWMLSTAPVGPGALNTPAGQLFQTGARPGMEVNLGGIKKTSPEVQSSGRQALPEDLFAANYLSSMQAPAWAARPSYGFHFNMPYHTAMPMLSFPHPSKSINPFDVNNELPPVQAPTFPSMASLQGSLPNVAAPANTMHTSPAWMPSQQPYPSAMPLRAQSFASAMPPSAYMGQQTPNNTLPVQGLVNEGATLGSMNPNQQIGGMYSSPPAAQHTFSTVGGNPFG